MMPRRKSDALGVLNVQEMVARAKGWVCGLSPFFVAT